MANQNGPFDAYLDPTQTPPTQTYQSTAKGVSGYGNFKSESVPLFIDKFMEGFSRGRAMAYQRNEQEQGRRYKQVQEAQQFLESHPDLAPDVRSAAENKLQALRMGLFAEKVDGAVGGSGKKGKGGSQQGSQGEGGASGAGGEGGDPKHSALQGVQKLLDAVVGPRPKKYEIGQDKVQAVLGDIYKDVAQPTASIQYRNQQLGHVFTQTLGMIEQQAGRKLTRDEIMKVPVLADTVNQASMLHGGKDLPQAMKIALSEAPTTLTQQEQAQLELTKQQAATSKANEEYYRAGAKERNAPEIDLYKNSKGETIEYNKTDNKWMLPGGKPAPDSMLVDLHKIGTETKPAADKWITKQSRDGQWISQNLTTGESKTLTGPDGKVVTSETSLGRGLILQNLRQQFDADRDAVKLSDGIDKLIDGVEKNSKMTPAEKAAEKQRLETQRESLTGQMTETPPSRKASGGSSPKKPTAPKTPAPAEMNDEQLLNNLFGGSSSGGSAAAGGAKKPKTAAEYVPKQ